MVNKIVSVTFLKFHFDNPFLLGDRITDERHHKGYDE